MNPSLIVPAFKAASSAWSKFNDRRDSKSREAYDSLEDALNKMGNDSSDTFPEARKKAGAVTRAAHSRLEKALSDLDDRRKELQDDASDATKSLSSFFGDAEDDAKKKGKKAKKQAKGVSKKAQKARKQARKKLNRKKSGRGFWSTASIIALLAAAAGAVYYVFRSSSEDEERNAPSQRPPRVDRDSSTLVYTSTTEDDAKAGSPDETTRNKDLGDTDADEKSTEPQPGQKQPQGATKLPHPAPEKKGGTASRIERPAGELAEDGAGETERDEELLNSIDEQLARLRNEKPQVVSSDRVTDDRADEGKHRLVEEDDEAKHRLNDEKTNGDVER